MTLIVWPFGRGGGLLPSRLSGRLQSARCAGVRRLAIFEAEGLRQALAVALERLVQGYIDQANYEPAIPYARRWLSLDPLHEPAHRALMQLYANSDQQAAALHQYEECVRQLDEEFGLPRRWRQRPSLRRLKPNACWALFLRPKRKETRSPRRKRRHLDLRRSRRLAGDTTGPIGPVRTFGRDRARRLCDGLSRSRYRFDRPVALKELKAALLTETRGLKRFHREAKLVARLDHPHIVPIYDVGQAQGDISS
ncbi:MAG: hypothetical protein H6633_34400 [Anaerolineales bacterium]|nr:hypothetical protein [Anaerolineales bacterium]